MKIISLNRLCFAFVAPFLVTACLAGCSLMSSRSSKAGSGAQPEIKDVPFQARDSRDTSPRKRIIVLPFIDSQTTRSGKAAVAARDAFVRALKKTDEFVIVANSDFPTEVTNYLKNGEYDLEAMSKVGGAMGLAGIVEGKVVDVKAKRLGDAIGMVREVKARLTATVQIRMVNTKNGSIALNEMKTGEVEDTVTRYMERTTSDTGLESDPQLIEGAVTQAFRQTIPRLVQAVEKLSWEGRVALVKGDRIYINAGRLSGLMIGDILKITEEGEEVFDPESGALIGKVQGRLKGTVEVVSYFGKDGAISIIHSGSGFRENDRVELY